MKPELKTELKKKFGLILLVFTLLKLKRAGFLVCGGRVFGPQI